MYGSIGLPNNIQFNYEKHILIIGSIGSINKRTLRSTLSIDISPIKKKAFASKS